MKSFIFFSLFFLVFYHVAHASDDYIIWTCGGGQVIVIEHDGHIHAFGLGFEMIDSKSEEEPEERSYKTEHEIKSEYCGGSPDGDGHASFEWGEYWECMEAYEQARWNYEESGYPDEAYRMELLIEERKDE